jgi:hypothetical protein
VALHEHRAAVARALQAGDKLGAVFNRMGSVDNPRGVVLSAYREARKAIDLSSARRTRETLDYLRGSLESSAQTLLEQSAHAGQQLAQQDIAAYAELADVPLDQQSMGGIIDDSLAAWLATFDQQYAAIMAMVANYLADEAEILGGETSAGVLNPAPFIAAGTRWTGNVLAGVWGDIIRNATQPATRAAADVFLKQAVATMDERVTPCCLAVHSQVQPMEGLFVTSEPPAWAPRQKQPPFHNYCRTAMALVRAEDAGDLLTQQMRDAADAEIAAREETGRRVEIHPASARSRRGRGG